MNTIEAIEADIDTLLAEAEKLCERRKPEALGLAHNILELALKQGRAIQLAKAHYIYAFYYCFVENNYDESIRESNRALEQLDEEDMLLLGHRIYMVLGNAMQLKGEIFTAQGMYLKGMRQLEAKKEMTEKEQLFLAAFYYNMGLLLTNSEINIESEGYLERAIATYTELGSTFKLSKCYLAYAAICEKKNDFVQARKYLEMALAIDRKNQDDYSIALSEANLGNILLRTGDPSEALENLRHSSQYFRQHGHEFELAMVLQCMSNAYYQMGSLHEAIRELMHAEEIFEKQDNRNELTAAYQSLSKFLEEAGDYQTSLTYQKKYSESLKYYFDVEKTNALTRAKKEFESEQQQKESAMLREKNEEISRYVKKLEVSNNELKQFAHVASHDMREPLRMINSYMTLLEKTLNGHITEQQKDFIHFAIDGARRMDLLIQDLLRLAKVDANPRIERLKLSMIVEEVKLNLDALISDKSAMITTGNLPELHADRTQVLQLIQNIVANGIRYNDNVHPVICINSVRRGKWLEIAISDNGPGIPGAYKEKVFQIFQRLHSHREIPGTGMGLAICKKIVEGMNGNIWIEDNPDGGTVFKFTLPMHTPAEVPVSV